MSFKHTEASMQKLIYSNQHRFCTSYEVMVPNCYNTHDNECDLYAIRKSGLCDEIEIKISRSDFLCDSKKHVAYRRSSGSEYREYNMLTESVKKKTIPPWSKTKHDCLCDGILSNYYWYVVKEGIAEAHEAPPWAGFVTVDDNGRMKVIRSPKRLHRGKLTTEEMYKTARKMYFRYWNLV